MNRHDELYNECWLELHSFLSEALLIYPGESFSVQDFLDLMSIIEPKFDSANIQ